MGMTADKDIQREAEAFAEMQLKPRRAITTWDRCRADVIAGRDPDDAIAEQLERHMAGRIGLAEYERRVAEILRLAARREP